MRKVCRLALHEESIATCAAQYFWLYLQVPLTKLIRRKERLDSLSARNGFFTKLINAAVRRLDSLSEKCLPTSFLYARDLTFVSQFTEANSADTVFSQYRMRTAADIASSIFSCGEFLFALLFDFH